MPIKSFAANIEHTVQPYVGDHLSTVIAIAIVAIGIASVSSLAISFCIISLQHWFGDHKDKRTGSPQKTNSERKDEVPLAPAVPTVPSGPQLRSYYQRICWCWCIRKSTSESKYIHFQIPLSLVPLDYNDKPILLRMMVPSYCRTLTSFKSLIMDKLKESNILTTTNTVSDGTLIKLIHVPWIVTLSDTDGTKVSRNPPLDTNDTGTHTSKKNTVSWILTNDDDILTLPENSTVQIIDKRE